MTASRTDDTDRPPHITPLFVELLELAAAERGLPPEPWPLPAA